MLSKDGMIEVGKISKQWTGFVREAFTDADNFGATFPMDLDVKMKAVLLGAVFLIVIYLKVVDNFLQIRVNLFLCRILCITSRPILVRITGDKQHKIMTYE